MPPRVYGGAPKCPTCDKSVYAAEQVLGPAGTVRHSIRIPPSPRCSRGSSTSPHTSADPVHRRAQYHKLCLKCKQCGKLLEPRLLVDHDGQAYCKACHGKSYGTKGYGAGGALVGEYAPRSVESSPTKHAPVSPPTAPSARPVAAAPPPAVPTRPLFASPAPPRPTPPPPVAPAPAARGPSPVPSSAAPAPSAPAAPVAPASSLLARPAPPPKPASIVSRAGAAASTPSTDGDSADASSAQPHKVATPAFDDDDQRGPLTSSTPGRSSLTSPSALADSLSSLSIPTRSRTSLTSAPPSLSNLPSLCPSCSKPVYHAERVTALSRAWHRACLRCSGCGTGLGNQPGRIEEKEGSPWCRRCYQERWGITGGMGMTTRPGLY
ncbi:hypothetical protein DMC30DRAFT_213373 [Rhodotorula diobovata]|uniref:LIM zinc-binding domain-containing protein n=1 Tax=Rhodotorula diobovata TaxID=5288 RepID=A0A5C5G4U3_9BASI|nr:hypothetical protein DMC30DRAFT_213373 [Rhodotorula diobovata]